MLTMTKSDLNAQLFCDRSTTACFTGHRPEGFPFENGDNVRINIIKSILLCKIEQAYAKGYRTFITGMARGVDTWAAMCVVCLKKTYPDIKLIGISPFKSEFSQRKGQDKWDYSIIANCADKMIYLHEGYIKSCYFERNRFMVDHSSLVIGVVYNRKSGTGGTIHYAAKRGVKADIVDICELMKNKIV